ncbi:MAG: hypothetical protein ABII79_06150, partial [bacterium]
VNDQILETTKIILSPRRPIQPVADNASDSTPTVPTLRNQLSDTVALYDPPFEPYALPIPATGQTRLNKRPTTRSTQPTLLPMTTTVANSTVHTAVPTESF